MTAVSALKNDNLATTALQRALSGGSVPAWLHGRGVCVAPVSDDMIALACQLLARARDSRHALHHPDAWICLETQALRFTPPENAHVQTFTPLRI